MKLVQKYRYTFLICLFLLSSFCMPNNNAMAEEQPRYYTERGDTEILADAPWRVSSSTATIPIEVVLKDAGSVKLKKIVIYDATAGATKKTDTSVDGVYPGAYWEGVYNSLRVSDFLPDNNFYINIKVEINYEFGTTGIPGKFTQYLRVWVGIPLPSLPGWYGGDTHYHSEYTGDIHYDNPDSNPDEVTEFGGSLKMTVYAARAIGLDWTCVTDHAYYLDDGTWDEYVNAINNFRNWFGFNLILGEEVSPRTMDDEDCSLHLLVFGMSDYVVGDEHRHLSADHSKNLGEVLNNLHGGFAFGAHPLNSYSGYIECPDYDLEQELTHLWSYWQRLDYGTALGSSSFAGFQFWNRRDTTGKINLGGDYPDEIPAPPFIYNPAWRYELMDGLVKWNELNLRTLNTNNYDYGKKIFMIGGSDAHGHFNYEVNASFDKFGDNDASQNNNAFGKVRTYVYCPGGNTKNNVLYALRNGHSIVTDGPLVIFGIDKNKDGDIRDSVDIIIGESTQLAEGEHPTFLIQWKSTVELGPIEYIKIKRGEYNDCGHSWVNPKWIYIDSSNGLDGSIEYKDSTADPCTNYFYRVEAFTTETHRTSRKFALLSILQCLYQSYMGLFQPFNFLCPRIRTVV